MSSRGGVGGFASGPSHPLLAKPSAKRPLVIKPFKSAPQVAAEDLGEATWSRLRAALAAVAARSPIEVSKEELCQVRRLGSNHLLFDDGVAVRRTIRAWSRRACTGWAVCCTRGCRPSAVRT
jgi:hypothetical protein